MAGEEPDANATRGKDLSITARRGERRRKAIIEKRLPKRKGLARVEGTSFLKREPARNQKQRVRGDRRKKRKRRLVSTAQERR